MQAEEKRLAVGLSDTFRLFQAQRDLTTQLNSELNAIIAYNRALINFEAVQTVPLRRRILEARVPGCQRAAALWHPRTPGTLGTLALWPPSTLAL